MKIYKGKIWIAPETSEEWDWINSLGALEQRPVPVSITFDGHRGDAERVMTAAPQIEWLYGGAWENGDAGKIGFEFQVLSFREK